MRQVRMELGMGDAAQEAGAVLGLRANLLPVVQRSGQRSGLSVAVGSNQT